MIPIIPLWRAVFLGEAIGPFDQIRQVAPWNGPKPNDAWDVLQADGVLQFYVWRDLVFESWRNFQVPFWNPYQLAGTPLLANSQSGALYPPHILMGVLHIPTALAITLLAWFHLFWAGLGVSKLVRALGGTEIGGVVAGASFALSPFMLSWTALSSVITTVCWIPWALWAVGRIALSGEVGAAQKTDLRSVAVLAISIGMMLLGGHLQFAAYGIGAVLLFALLRSMTFVNKAASDRPDQNEESALGSPNSFGKNLGQFGKSGFAVLIGLLFGFLMASPQLLPVLKHSQTSHRKNVPSEAGYESYIGSAIKPFEFANLVTTKALGDPRIPVEVNENLTVAEYWPPLAKQGANFAESAVTIGPLVLGLLLLVPWRDRRTWPMAAIGVLALLLAMGTVLNKALYFWLPGWSSTGSPGRVIVLFVMAACVLAGLGVRDIQVGKRQLGIAALGLAGFTLISLFVFPGTKPAWQNGMDQLGAAVESIASVGILPSALLALVFGIAGLALWYKPQTTIHKPLILGLSVLVAISGYAINLIPTGMPLAKVRGPANPHDRVAIVNENWGIIAPARDAIMPPNLAALSRIHEVAGYDSLLSRETKDMLDDLNDQNSAPPANGNIMFVKPTADDFEKMDEVGVAEVWTRKPLEGYKPFKFTERDGFLSYALEAKVRVYAEGAEMAEITEETFGATTIKHSADSKEIILRDRWMPGWSASAGASVEPLTESYAKGPWLKVTPAPGSTETTLSFVSPGYSTGLFLAVPTWLLFLVGLAGGRIKKGKVETS